MSTKLTELLQKHEGFRAKPYKCTSGKLTIGYGRNLDDVGISKDEALQLLANDIRKCFTQLHDRYTWFRTLDSVRQEVLVNMCFNMGIAALSKFHNMIAHLTLGQFTQAAIEILESKYADQVGSRAKELAHMMETGKYSDGKFRT